MDPGLYADLKKILKTYVPRGATFYDLTAAPGWFYYLLHMRPASALTNITQADTSSLLPSKLIIDGIARTRPPLIAFADWDVGLPVYDGILNEVRDYVVSQYVLDHYTPVFESHTVLFMARNDLASHLRRSPSPHRAAAHNEPLRPVRALRLGVFGELFALSPERSVSHHAGCDCTPRRNRYPSRLGL